MTFDRQDLEYRFADDDPGLDTMMPEVYDHLRNIAHSMLGDADKKGFTLQATAVVHEAWAKMSNNNIKPVDRKHLISLACCAIRQVVIDYARTRSRVKRGSGKNKLQLDEAIVSAQERNIDLISLDDALKELATFGPRQAQIVEMKFFGSLTMSEISEMLGVSKRTVEQDWVTAKTWLHKKLG